jgi:hypothetical protein
MSGVHGTPAEASSVKAWCAPAASPALAHRPKRVLGLLLLLLLLPARGGARSGGGARAHQGLAGGASDTRGGRSAALVMATVIALRRLGTLLALLRLGLRRPEASATRAAATSATSAAATSATCGAWWWWWCCCCRALCARHECLRIDADGPVVASDLRVGCHAQPIRKVMRARAHVRRVGRQHEDGFLLAIDNLLPERGQVVP